MMRSVLASSFRGVSSSSHYGGGEIRANYGANEHHLQAGSSEESRLSAHIGTSQQHDLLVEDYVVGYEVGHVQPGVLSLHDLKLALVEAGPNAAHLLRVEAD